MNYKITFNEILIFFPINSGEMEYLFTSAKVIRRGSNGRFSGGLSHCNLCFTEPWTNLKYKNQ